MTKSITLSSTRRAMYRDGRIFSDDMFFQDGFVSYYRSTFISFTLIWLEVHFASRVEV